MDSQAAPIRLFSSSRFCRCCSFFLASLRTAQTLARVLKPSSTGPQVVTCSPNRLASTLRSPVWHAGQQALSRCWDRRHTPCRVLLTNLDSKVWISRRRHSRSVTLEIGEICRLLKPSLVQPRLLSKEGPGIRGTGKLPTYITSRCQDDAQHPIHSFSSDSHGTAMLGICTKPT